MQQAKVSLTPLLSDFISNYKFYGFKDKSAMIQAALLRLKQELELQSLRDSANLYAEIYEEDNELQELTQTTLDGWPE
jgi:hypothetical protein